MFTIIELDENEVNDTTHFKFKTVDQAIKAVKNNKDGFANCFYNCAIVKMNKDEDECFEIIKEFSAEDLDKLHGKDRC